MAKEKMGDFKLEDKPQVVLSKTQKGNERAKNIVRNYRKLGFKRFFQVWGRGIEGITPYQQAKTELKGQVIILVGTVWGIVYMGIVSSKDHTWWIFVMLIGGLIVLLASMAGTYQKYVRLKAQEKLIREAMRG